jgi:SAM-dependent methyltransferase
VTDFGGEFDRARASFTARDRAGRTRALYDPLTPGALFRLQEREWTFAELFRRAGIRSLSGLEILEVGCGSAASLARFVGLGAAPARLHGIDLVPERVAAGRLLLPQADLREGSAHQLPYPDGQFDLVANLTLFSSVLDPRLQESIAAEMLRVLRPGGVILWYDACRSAPSRDFVPIDARRLADLFPGCSIDLRTVTLRWGLIYRLAALSRTVALAAQRVPWLCSHHAAVIRPRETGAGTTDQDGVPRGTS